MNEIKEDPIFLAEENEIASRAGAKKKKLWAVR
jgi:hypothetical protein